MNPSVCRDLSCLAVRGRKALYERIGSDLPTPHKRNPRFQSTIRILLVLWLISISVFCRNGSVLKWFEVRFLSGAESARPDLHVK